MVIKAAVSWMNTQNLNCLFATVVVLHLMVSCSDLVCRGFLLGFMPRAFIINCFIPNSVVSWFPDPLLPFAGDIGLEGFLIE